MNMNIIMNNEQEHEHEHEYEQRAIKKLCEKVQYNTIIHTYTCAYTYINTYTLNIVL